MQRVIENYINGNLTDAKKGAKRCGFQALRTELQENYGYSFRAADAIALYLKGQMGFQEHCDIKHAEADAAKA